MSRSTDNQILISGRNMVLDALKSDRTIYQILISTEVTPDDRVNEILKLAKDKKILVSTVSPKHLMKVEQNSNSQGIAAFMENQLNSSLEEIVKFNENVTILMFNHLDYEQNLGAILRTAWATGVSAIVCAPNGVSKLTPTVTKISQGGAAYVPLFRKSLLQTFDLLKKYNIPIVGVEVDQGEVYYKQNITGPIAFLFGGESVGISDPLMKKCDLFINIPMMGSLASINVSVATAVIMFEKRRQES